MMKINMIQLNLFESLPLIFIQTEWEKEHIKNPPPKNVSEEQRRIAQQKIHEINKLKNSVKIKIQ